MEMCHLILPNLQITSLAAAADNIYFQVYATTVR